MKEPLILLPALAALGLLMAACGPDPTSAPAVNQVTFTAYDYAYGGLQFMPAVMTEIGGELHHQQLMTIPEGMSSDGLIAGMLSGEAGPSPLRVTSAGLVGPIGPGGNGRTTLNMTAGNYLAICFIPNSKGVLHMAQGMNKPITVIESSAPVAPLPSAKVLVDMVDFGFGLSEPIATGSQNINLVNKGEQEYEALLIRLAPGATAMDFVDSFAPDAPPGEALGGFQVVTSGVTGSFNVDITAGNYAFVCLVEDPNTGSPHFALGMIEEFSAH